MRKIPKREEVIFNSCKSKDGGSLAFDLKVIDAKMDSSSIHFSFKSELPVPPHPDLIDRLQLLKPRLVEAFGWILFTKLQSNKDFSASAAQKKYLKGALETIEDNIRVTGVQYIGKDNTGAIVKGTYDGYPINCKIYFTNQDWGEDMEKLVSEIADETYEYVYNDKYQQLEAFDD